METIGTRVRREREAQGLTRPELARKTGIGYSTISELERGGMQTSTKLHLIADALGVSIRWLETGRPPKEAKPPSASHALQPDRSKLEAATRFFEQLERSRPDLAISEASRLLIITSVYMELMAESEPNLVEMTVRYSRMMEAEAA